MTHPGKANGEQNSVHPVMQAAYSRGPASAPVKLQSASSVIVGIATLFKFETVVDTKAHPLPKNSFVGSSCANDEYDVLTDMSFPPLGF